MKNMITLRKASKKLNMSTGSLKIFLTDNNYDILEKYGSHFVSLKDIQKINIPDGYKFCLKCKANKTTDEFYSKENQCKDCHGIMGRKNYHKNMNPNKRTKLNLLNRLNRRGMNEEIYQKMIKDCNNKCYICKKEMETPHIDHCHKTNKVRGLLCKQCNSGLGQLTDNVSIMKSAIQYIKRHNNYQAISDPDYRQD